eukprot:491525_1
MVANHTAIKDLFNTFLKDFKSLYKKKAFLHWYYDEGMDEDNFEEASKQIQDLIIEYQEKGDTIVDLDNLDGYVNNLDDLDEEDEDDILAKYTSNNNDDSDNNNDNNDNDNDDEYEDAGFQPPEDDDDDNDNDNDDDDGDKDPWDD